MGQWGLVRLLARPDTYADIRRLLRSKAMAAPGYCPCCRTRGLFVGAGLPIRPGVECPNCGSVERHRQFALAVQRGELAIEGREVLHFAPERGIRQAIREARPARYVTSHYPPDPEADLSLDIEEIELDDGSFDVIVCSHVLEHVDDRRALAELHRVLRPGGTLVVMIPIVEGWDETYEDPTKTSEADRAEYFGQHDHVRYYGRDVRDKITAAGFALAELTAGPIDSVTCRLQRGDKIFLGSRAG